MRIEVWFNNGLFRAFPKVNKETLKEEESLREVSFEFGENKHIAVINMQNVNFVELMDEVDD